MSEILKNLRWMLVNWLLLLAIKATPESADSWDLIATLHGFFERQATRLQRDAAIRRFGKP